MLTEEEVYNGAKRWLIKNNYYILAGQPARGVDHLPVIEIKQSIGGKQGSENSYKPDLVAYKDNTFYIIECKPSFNRGDLEKINSVLNSKQRIRNLYFELEQYNLLRKINYKLPFSLFCDSVKGVLAFSGEWGPECNLHKLLVFDWKGEASFK